MYSSSVNSLYLKTEKDLSPGVHPADLEFRKYENFSKKLANELQKANDEINKANNEVKNTANNIDNILNLDKLN